MSRGGGSGGGAVNGTVVGKYLVGRLIGEGNFAKVRIALDRQTGEKVAVKVIDKQAITHNKLVCQVRREIATMKLLHHPNIVRIHEVHATRTKIFIFMEYVSGGQLSAKMNQKKRLSEEDCKKYFQQLIDAVDYCHGRGVYHRDLKPDNLLVDRNGNLKVSDFGLSILRKHPGELLATSCGSPCYVAPEVISHRAYDGSAADVWSCGVILFECLAGYLPFQDKCLPNLYRKISLAAFKFPSWFTPLQKNLISRILNTSPLKRITIPEILEDKWFQMGYKPSHAIQHEERMRLDEALEELERNECDTNRNSEPQSPSFVNAFQLIALSSDLDLSGLFEEDNSSQKMKLCSSYSTIETLRRIEVAAKDVSLSVDRMNISKLNPHYSSSISQVNLHGFKKLARSRSHIMVSAQVLEVTPTQCVVELSRSVGELRTYKEFCRSLSNTLNECACSPAELNNTTSPSDTNVEE